MLVLWGMKGWVTSAVLPRMCRNGRTGIWVIGVVRRREAYNKSPLARQAVPGSDGFDESRDRVKQDHRSKRLWAC